jgi:hypothetical protein
MRCERARITHISPSGGANVATIGIGYLQPPSQFGEYPRDAEATCYQITERPEPIRGYHHPLWPDITIDDAPDFNERGAS